MILPVSFCFFDIATVCVCVCVCTHAHTCMCVCMLSHIQFFVTPWTVTHQAPHPWNFPGRSTEAGCHFLLQRMFPTQGLNLRLLRLLHCRQILYVEPPGKCKLHVYICLLHIYKYCCSVAKLCLTLCNPVDCSTQGSSVLHYLPEFAQIYVHWVRDANQPSHPLLPASPFAFNLSQHRGLFQWVGSSHQVAKVLELWLQYQPLMNIVPVIFLSDNADSDQWNLSSFLLFLLFSGSFFLALMFCFKSTKFNGLAEMKLSSDGDVKGQRL